MFNFQWSQGQGHVYMGSYDERFCFLTRVSGNFEGSGESVHVYYSSGNWYLGGTSSQSGVSASATCIPRDYWGQYLQIGPEKIWNSPIYPIDLGSVTNRVCFLTYVSGKFMGAGERVYTYVSNNKWYISGNSGGYYDIAGGARCVTTTTGVAGPYNWAQGQAAVAMANANDWVCGLTRVQGKLAGAAESVVSYIVNDVWHLGGTSNQSGVSGAAYCM